MSKFIFFSFILMIAVVDLASAKDSQKNHLCNNSQINIADFVSKNDEIIRVFMYGGASSEGNYLLIDSLKKEMPINFQFTFTINGEGIVGQDSEMLSEVYWGISKKEFSREIDGKSRNCITIDKKDELLSELKNWEQENLPLLDRLAESYDYAKAEEEINKKNFSTKSKRYAWRALKHFLEFKPHLALKMVDGGFPVDDDLAEEHALFAGIWHSNKEFVEIALRRKANVNYVVKSNGLHPLLIATAIGNFEIVKLLIDHGAQVKPIPPVSQNVLCFLGGGHRTRGGSFERTLDHVNSITELLLERGADVNAQCNSQDKSLPFDKLGKSPHLLEVKKKLLKSDNRFFLDTNKKVKPPSELSELFKIKQDPSSDQIRDFLELKQHISSKDFPRKIDRPTLGRLFYSSIVFGDFDNFKKIADELKPDFKFLVPRELNSTATKCSLPYDDISPRYYQFLMQFGFKFDSTCESDTKEKLFNVLVNSCDFETLKLIPKEEAKLYSVPMKDISEMFSYWDFKAPDYGIDCFETMKVITEKNIVYDRYGFLRIVLELGIKSLFDKALEANIFDSDLLQNAIEIYEKDRYLMPLNDDFSSKSVPVKMRNYLFYKIKEMGIKKKQGIATVVDTKKNNQIVLIKKQYPFCSEEGTVPAFKRKIDLDPVLFLSSCSKIEKNSSLYFELYETDSDFSSLISVNDSFPGRTEEIYTGAKIYVRPGHLSTPFILTDGEIKIALPLAGIRSITLSGTKYRPEGDKDLCKGVDVPIIQNGKELGKDFYELPANFKVNQIRVVNNLGRSIEQICGSSHLKK